MKHTCLLFLLLVSGTLSLRAQINVGSAVAPHPSAMLEVSGNTKGFLPPRMSRENMYLIASPATGLLVFNTTDSLLFIRRDTGWVAVSAGISPWLKKGDTIYNAGRERVGIGTSSPQARLHVTDSSVLFSALSTTATSPTAPPASGAGRRMMWYADKAAFRVGYVAGAGWDQSNIGNYSFASGYDTRASGINSTAIGIGSNASGTASTAMGNYTLASGSYSTALGSNNAAVGSFSLTTGLNTQASGYSSTAMGLNTNADGDYTTAIGTNTTAGGNTSTAIGFGITTPSYAETSIGNYNTSYTPVSTTSFNSNDRLFTIGNGTSATSTSNAVVVLKNGNVGFGTSTPSAKLHVLGTVKFESLISGYLTADASGNITTTSFPVNSTAYIQNQTAADQAAGLRISGNALFNGGRVGINIATPLAKLHVADSSVLFSASGLVGSSPAAPPTSGAGRRMMWYADKAAFRVGYVSNTNWDQNNVGNYSFASGFDARALYLYTTAMGYGTTASGIAATAIGYGTAAGGNYSTAIGFVTAASAYGSTAMGYNTTASGYYTTAMGYHTTAPSFAETSIGMYNTSYTPVSTTDINSNDRLFTIGNGTLASATSDAMVVLKNGNIGIGTALPSARLHVTDNSVLFSASNSAVSSPAAPPASGVGRRMMWYADKAAFRAGYVLGTNWDQDNIGTYSFAGGYDTKASGNSSVAIGTYATATASYTTAFGYNTTASGNASTAMGAATVASGSYSTTMGVGTTASSYAEISIGSYNTSYTPASATFFNSTDRLFTIGNGSSSSATSDAVVVLKNGKIGLGTSTPYSQLSNTSGNPLDEQGSGADANSFVWTGGSNSGYAATVSSPQSRGLLVKTDGTTSTSNAFEVMAGGTNLLSVKGNGNVGIGTVSPSQKLTVNGNIVATGSITQNSDIRFKNEIRPLQHSLEAVMRMQGVSWKWKVNEFKDRAFTADKQIGFIAQEIEKVVPEVVFTDAQGYKSIDYAKITAVLTEAVKAQQAEIQSQQEQIANLKKELAALQQQSDVSELAKKVAQLESLLQTKAAISEDTRISK